MKLILKSLLRSIRSSPFQPLLIILTVALSMAIATTAFGVCQKENENALEHEKNSWEIGDVTVTARSDSGERILFVEDVEACIEDRADVTGEFSFVGFMDGADKESDSGRVAVSVAAVDLEDVDRFYEFEYFSYGYITTENVDSIAVISKSFADARGLSVGDSFELSLVQEEMVYVVEAIAHDSGILCERDVLISFSGLGEMLTRKIPSLAILGDSFAPCTRVMVKAVSGVSGEEILDTLSGSDAMLDKNAVLTKTEQKVEFWMLVRSVAIYTITVFIFLLAAFLISTSLTLLSKKRSAEFLKFSIAGASPAQTSSVRCVECLIYALVGIALGCVLAIPLTNAAGVVCGWEIPLRLAALLTGGIMTLVLMGACTFNHVFKPQKREKSARGEKRLYVYAWVVFLALIAIIFLIPVKYRYLPCIAAITLCVLLAFKTASLLLKAVARCFERRYEKRDVQSATVFVCLKSVRRRGAYSFFCGAIAVMLSILAVMSVCQRTMRDQTELFLDGIGADVVAFGLNESARQRLLNDGDVEQAVSLYYNTSTKMLDGTTAIAISSDASLSCFIDEKMLPKDTPRRNEIVISKGLARLEGVRVGDEICVDIGGAQASFTVKEILAVNNNIFYFDSEYIGIRRNIVFVDLKNADSEAKERVIAIIESDGARASGSVADSGILSGNIRGNTRLLFYATLISAVLSVIGTVNVLVALNTERKEECQRLIECGMRASSVRRLKVCELCFTSFVGIAVAVAFALAMCILVDVALGSFGMILFSF